MKNRHAIDTLDKEFFKLLDDKQYLEDSLKNIKARPTQYSEEYRAYTVIELDSVNKKLEEVESALQILENIGNE